MYVTGLSLSELSIAELDDLDGVRLYCDNCKTTIFALHKHCQTCMMQYASILVVNVLTHVAEVKLGSEDVTAIEKLMPKNLEQDKRELHDIHQDWEANDIISSDTGANDDGASSRSKLKEVEKGDSLLDAVDSLDGALWDIFR
ncbi:transcription factor jumonji (jmjC) domain protein, partial [Trifolium medium]|nr:transcription factor jumonji (jmjC) domain protein [Trifolium medium]